MVVGGGRRDAGSGLEEKPRVHEVLLRRPARLHLHGPWWRSARARVGERRRGGGGEGRAVSPGESVRAHGWSGVLGVPVRRVVASRAARCGPGGGGGGGGVGG